MATAGRGSSTYTKQQDKYLELGRTLLTKAIEADERGDVVEAVRYYEEGSKKLKEGMMIQTFPDHEVQAARKRFEIMEKHANSADERVKAIKEKQKPSVAKQASGMASSLLSKFESVVKTGGNSGRASPSGSSQPRIMNDKMYARPGTGTQPERAGGAPTGGAQPKTYSNLVGSGPPHSRGTSQQPVGQGPPSSSTSRGGSSSGVVRGGGGAIRSSGATTSGTSTRGGATSRGTSASAYRGGGASMHKPGKIDGVDPKIVELILNEVVDNSPSVPWDSIAGLQNAKQTLNEIVILPSLRPDIFQGLRAPPKGMLLFGPPGNGKTMLAKAVASEAQCNFFNISASSLTSKWVGEGEKIVRGLFAVARHLQPAVIFIDEIDSILSSRGGGTEHEASRRLKTEFLVQCDGVGSGQDERILVMGATNLPWELDQAVIRRLVKRIYVPLPDPVTRTHLIQNLLKTQNKLSIGARELRDIVNMTEGYSGSDLTALCKEAAMGPVREVGMNQLRNMDMKNLRGLNLGDFKHAQTVIRPSVGAESLRQFQDWNKKFGSFS